MGGIGLIVVVALYVFIAYKIVEAVERKWLKAMMMVSALLIPTADAIYGRIKLKHMCEAEAGLKVYRVVGHVDGFMAGTAFSDYWVKEHGYLFAEDKPLYGTKTSRYTLESSGEIKVEKDVLPKSQYRLRQNDFGEKEAYGHSQYLIEEIPSGEILATDTQVTFHGGWAERFLAKFSDAGGGNVAWCFNHPYPEVREANLVNSTLKH
jgi:hypothetical protein